MQEIKPLIDRIMSANEDMLRILAVALISKVLADCTLSLGGHSYMTDKGKQLIKTFIEIMDKHAG